MKQFCNKCDLCMSARNQLEPHSSDKSNIIWVFGYPNHSQNAKGIFFTGRQMKAFAKVLHAYNMFTISHFTTILKCRPRNVDMMEFKQIELEFYKCSSHHFMQEFAKISKDVKVIVTFGKFAFQHISGIEKMNMKEWDAVVNVPQLVGDYIVFPMVALVALGNSNSLINSIDSLYQYYSNNVDKRLLVRKIDNHSLHEMV